MLGFNLPKLPPAPKGTVTQSELRKAMMYVADQTLTQVPFLSKGMRLTLGSYLAAMPDKVLDNIVDTILTLGARLDAIRREGKSAD